MSTLTDERAGEALAPLRPMLNADGYDLLLSLGGEPDLVLDIRATEAACADCLVPPEMIEMMARSCLTDAGEPADAISLQILHPRDR